jgi:hypothetical protein
MGSSDIAIAKIIASTMILFSSNAVINISDKVKNSVTKM